MLEDLKPQLGELKEKLDHMAEALEIPVKEEKIAELEYKMGEPTFWDDAEAAQKINQELADLKSGVDKYKALRSKHEDAETLLEMGLEEDDPSMEEDVKAELDEVAEGLEALQLEVLLSGPYDANNAILTLHAGAGGTEAQDWTQMLLRMYGRWAGSPRRAFTVWCAFLPLMPMPAATLLSPLAISCRRLTMRWKWISIWLMCGWIHIAPAAPAASTSTRLPPLSA